VNIAFSDGISAVQCDLCFANIAVERTIIFCCRTQQKLTTKGSPEGLCQVIHSTVLMNSLQLVAIQYRASFAVCVGTPSSWFLRASILVGKE